MGALEQTTYPLTGTRECLRKFWPYLVPYWILPVPLFLLSLHFGYPRLGVCSVAIFGFIAAIPVIRGRMNLTPALVLFCGITFVAWLTIYLVAIMLFGASAKT